LRAIVGDMIILSTIVASFVAPILTSLGTELVLLGIIIVPSSFQL
jgi:hypothetical protein